MLSEALEKPVSTATFNSKFEWEVAYMFPLVVIGLIQLLLIFAMLLRGEYCLIDSLMLSLLFRISQIITYIGF